MIISIIISFKSRIENSKIKIRKFSIYLSILVSLAIWVSLFFSVSVLFIYTLQKNCFSLPKYSNEVSIIQAIVESTNPIIPYNIIR